MTTPTVPLDDAQPAGPDREVAEIDPLTRIAGRMARLGFARSREAAALITSEPLALWDVTTNAATDDGAAAIVAALGRTAGPGSRAGCAGRARRGPGR